MHSIYHTGFNPLARDHRTFGLYWVTHLCDGPWMYIMDDYGNAVPYNGTYYDGAYWAREAR